MAYKPANMSTLSKSASKASSAEKAALQGSPTTSPGVKNLMDASAMPPAIPPKSTKTAKTKQTVKMAKGGLVVDSRGQSVDMGRPELENEDGTFSTEETITVTDPRINGGRPTNIPSIWHGKRPPSSDDAVVEDYAISNALESKQSFPSYDTIEEAVKAAEQRSGELENLRRPQVPGLAKGGLMVRQEDGEYEEVPPGARPSEVLDQHDVKLSDGEVVIPADVVRWVGLEKLEKMRQSAKTGLMAMATEGRIQEGGREDRVDVDEPIVSIPKLAEGGMVEDSYATAYNAKNPSTPVKAVVDTSGRKGYQYGDTPGPKVTASKYTPSTVSAGTTTGTTTPTVVDKSPSTLDQIANVAGGAAGIIGTSVATDVAKDVIGGQSLSGAVDSNIVQPVSELLGAGGMNGGTAAAAAGAPGQLTAPGALSPAEVTTSALGDTSAAGTSTSTASTSTSSLSQGLGGAASGAVIGWSVGKLTGGNTTASTVTGAVSGLITSGALGFGSTAGLSGTLWGTGAIGGPVGLGVAVVTSIIAGQLFKTKPSNKAAEAQVTFDATEGAQVVLGDSEKASKRDPENQAIRDGYVTIASEFGSMLYKAGATAVPQVQLNIGSRDGWQMSVGYWSGSHGDNYEFTMKQNSTDLAATMVMDMVKDSRGLSEDVKSRFTDINLIKYSMAKDDFSALFDSSVNLQNLYNSDDYKKYMNSLTTKTVSQDEQASDYY